MDNKYNAVMAFINRCPLVGRDTYFNFIDETNNDGNTSLLTVPYSTPYKKYVDGDILWRMQFEIRQVKPLSSESNTEANAEQIQLVQEFLDWINAQGKKQNYPDFGERCNIISMSTNDVSTPSFAGADEKGALYAFPFEILYFERK